MTDSNEPTVLGGSDKNKKTSFNGIKIPEGFSVENFPKSNRNESTSLNKPEPPINIPVRQESKKEPAVSLLRRLKSKLYINFSKIKDEIDAVPQSERAKLDLNLYASRVDAVNYDSLSSEDRIEFEKQLEKIKRVELPKLINPETIKSPSKGSIKKIEVIDRGEYDLDERKRYVDRTIEARLEKIKKSIKEGDRKEFDDVATLSTEQIDSKKLSDDERSALVGYIELKNNELLAAKRIGEKSFKDAISDSVEQNSAELPESNVIENRVLSESGQLEKPDKSEIWEVFKFVFRDEDGLIKDLSLENKKIMGLDMTNRIVEQLRDGFEKFVEEDKDGKVTRGNLRESVREFCSNRKNFSDIKTTSTKKEKIFEAIMKTVKMLDVHHEEEPIQTVIEDEVKEEKEVNEVREEALSPAVSVSSSETGENFQELFTINTEDESEFERYWKKSINAERDPYKDWTMSELVEAERNFSETISILNENVEVVGILEKKIVQIRGKIKEMENENTENEVVLETADEAEIGNEKKIPDSEKNQIQENDLETGDDVYFNWTKEQLLEADENLGNAISISGNNYELLEMLEKRRKIIADKLAIVESTQGESMITPVDEETPIFMAAGLEPEKIIEKPLKKSIIERVTTKDKKDSISIENENTPEIVLDGDEKSIQENKALRDEKEKIANQAKSELEFARKEYVFEEAKKREAYGKILGFLQIKNSSDLEKDPDLAFYKEEYGNKLDLFKKAKVDLAKLDAFSDRDIEALNAHIDRQEKMNLWLEMSNKKLENMKIDFPERFGFKSIFKKATNLIKKTGLVGTFCLLLAVDTGKINEEKPDNENKTDSAQTVPITAENESRLREIALEAGAEEQGEQSDNSDAYKKNKMQDKMSMGKDEYEKFKADFEVVTSKINKSIFNGNHELFISMRGKELYGNEAEILEKLDKEGRAAAEGFMKTSPPKQGETINHWVGRVALESLE